MTRLHLRRAGAVAALVLITIICASSTASAQGRDRTPPTAPTNLHVIATTPYSVTLAWTPSTDNSGKFAYRICCGNTQGATVDQTATSFTFTAGLEAGRPYSLRMFAIDAAGNASPYSNTVSGTLPPDRTPPPTPVVSVTDVGPTHVSLAWASTDDGPFVWYWVNQDGVPILQGIRDRNGIAHLLKPSTTYTFTVRARDFAANWSPVSAPVMVTTSAPNPNDVTPPTPPANLREDHYDDEIELRWDQSTDDLDPQSLIRYDVFINGELNAVVVGTGRIVVSGVAGVNTIEVVAVDTAGNRSAPSTITVVI